MEQATTSGKAFLSVLIEGPRQAVVIIDAVYGEDIPLRVFAEQFSQKAFQAIRLGQPDAPEVSTHFAKISATQVNEWFSFPTPDGKPMAFVREYHLMHAAGKTAFLIFQGSREDLAGTRPGFRMIHDSLRLD